MSMLMCSGVNWVEGLRGSEVQKFRGSMVLLSRGSVVYIYYYYCLLVSDLFFNAFEVSNEIDQFGFYHSCLC